MRGSEQALNDQAVNPAATPLAACAETSGPGAAVAIQQNTQGQNVRFGGMTSKYASSGSRPRGTATATMPHVRVRPATESALTQINCALDPSASVTKTFPVWVCGTPKWTPYSDRYISVTVNSSGSSACPSGQFQSVNVNLTVKRTALEIPGGSDGIQLSGVNTGGLAVLVIVPATIEIQDLNVTAGNNVVSSPAPTPSPIMIGQQVQFKAVAVRGTIVVFPRRGTRAAAIGAAGTELSREPRNRRPGGSPSKPHPFFLAKGRNPACLGDRHGSDSKRGVQSWSSAGCAGGRLLSD